MSSATTTAKHSLPLIASRSVTVAAALCFAGYIYCQATTFLFTSDGDGSFLMYRAAQLGLVSQSYAQAHLLDVVPFRKDSDGLWEYRVPSPVLGYAPIPGLIVHRTSRNLLEACDTRDPQGNYGCRDRSEY